MRYEYDQGGSRPREANNVIQDDLLMLESQRTRAHQTHEASVLLKSQRQQTPGTSAPPDGEDEDAYRMIQQGDQMQRRLSHLQPNIQLQAPHRSSSSKLKVTQKSRDIFSRDHGFELNKRQQEQKHESKVLAERAVFLDHTAVKRDMPESYTDYASHWLNKDSSLPNTACSSQRMQTGKSAVSTAISPNKLLLAHEDLNQPQGCLSNGS